MFWEPQSTILVHREVPLKPLQKVPNLDIQAVFALFFNIFLHVLRYTPRHVPQCYDNVSQG